MSRIALFGGLLVCLVWAQSKDGFTQKLARVRELRSIQLSQLSNLKSTDLQVYGLQVGTPLSQIKRRVATYGLRVAGSEDAIGLFAISKAVPPPGIYSGVDASVEDGAISWIRIISKTRMNDPRDPQTLYVSRMLPELRSFFEHYSDEVRLKVFGPTERSLNVESGSFRQYLYDYPERGIQLDVYAWVENGAWREELAQFRLYPPDPTQTTSTP